MCHTKSMSATIFVLNGPNLNLLGHRRPEIYGHTTLVDIELSVRERAALHGFDVEFMQTNYEGKLVDEIQRARTRGAAIVINPAAYTHTSVALHDALEAAELPVVGVPIAASLDGIDALLAIVQMPPGIPVATVGINGAQNAAILAAQMLALSDEALARRLANYKEGLKKKIVKANEELASVQFKFKTN